jgi:hypothetical protein
MGDSLITAHEFERVSGFFELSLGTHEFGEGVGVEQEQNAE